MIVSRWEKEYNKGGLIRVLRRNSMEEENDCDECGNG